MNCWITVAGEPAATGEYSPMPCIFLKDGAVKIGAAAWTGVAKNARYRLKASCTQFI